MKGMVFSFTGIKKRKRQKISFREFTAKYGLFCFFALCFLFGFIFGMVGAKNADENLLSGLDFLFSTNFENRLKQSAFEIFCGCFSSNFLFLLCAFLFGFSPWGFLLQPVFAAVKGYGVGLSAGYLFSVYGIKGAGFYLLVMLIGSCVFVFSLICECSNAFMLSIRLFKFIFVNTQREQFINPGVRVYLYRSGYMLMTATVAALLDMILWLLFAGIFNFT